MTIKRSVHVVFNPKTNKWEVWQLTEMEAFLLDEDYYGVEVALHNLKEFPLDGE